MDDGKLAWICADHQQFYSLAAVVENLALLTVAMEVTCGQGKPIYTCIKSCLPL